MLNLSDDNKIFREYTTIIELYNALKFISILFFIQKILRFNFDVAFLKSVSILIIHHTELFLCLMYNFRFIFLQDIDCWLESPQ